MRKMGSVFVVLLLMLACTSFAQPFHNITVENIVSPPLGGVRMRPGDSIEIIGRFRNGSTVVENNVRLIATFAIGDSTDYRDTQYVATWPIGEYLDIKFRDYIPSTVKGMPVLCFFSELPEDMNPLDNSVCALRNARLEADLTGTNVLFPSQDTVIREGSPIHVRGQFSNIGVRDHFDVRARVQIRSCTDRILRIQIDSMIPELFIDSTVEFVFPYRDDTVDIRTLKPGCYEIAVIIRLSDDVDRTNDTARTTFRIVDTTMANNIAAIEALSPVDNSTGPESPDPVDLWFRFVNMGMGDLEQVPITVSIVHQQLNVVHRDTLLSAFGSIDDQVVMFDSFAIPHHTGLGWYTATAVAHLWNDERPSDDTIVTRFFRGFARDIRTVAVLVPHNDQILSQGVAFFPKVLFDNVGLDTNTSEIPVNLKIYDCTTNQVVYERNETVWNKVMPVGNVYTFSSISDGFSTGQLPAGCYKIIVTNLDELDNNLANDQVYSQFTIEAVAKVEELANTLVAMHPNPTSGTVTLDLTLPLDCMVAMSLTDVLGNTHKIIDQTHYASGRHYIPLDLSHSPTGSYLYELTLTRHDGVTKRITKTLTVAR